MAPSSRHSFVFYLFTGFICYGVFHYCGVVSKRSSLDYVSEPKTSHTSSPNSGLQSVPKYNYGIPSKTAASNNGLKENMKPDYSRKRMKWDSLVQSHSQSRSASGNRLKTSRGMNFANSGLKFWRDPTLSKVYHKIGKNLQFDDCILRKKCHLWCDNKVRPSPNCCKVRSGNADCTCCNLTYIPQNLTTSITHLDLSFNHINDKSLHENVFQNYTSLQVLKLTCNQIRSFHKATFRGLPKLQHLNLLWNHIAMDQRLNTSEAFQPLSHSLQSLILNGNNPDPSLSDLEYPDYALSFLTNLRELHLDGLMNKSMHERFSQLRGLRVLHLAGFCPGYCNMTALNAHTFEHLGSITHLNISDCQLQRDFLDKETFSPLVNLEMLDIGNNFGLSLGIIGNLMWGLRNNANFKHLRMQRIGARFSPCVVVFKDDVVNFQNMSLETLEAPDNEIEMIEFGALENLPSTLKTLNMKNNKIMFGAYWQNLDVLTDLKEIILDNDFNLAKSFPSVFPSRDINCKETFELPRNKRDANMYGASQSQQQYLSLLLPPSLERVSMKYVSMAYNIGHLNFSSNNSLKEAYLQGNVFRELDGPVTGLSQLRKLDLSECFIETINNKFLKGFKSLEHLDLFQNLLGDSFHQDLHGKTFSSMSSLKHLNLSFNNLFYISEKFFIGCPSLHTLDLSTNRLQNISFDITHMSNLTSLLLSKNNVICLGPSDMEHIDKIYTKTKHFKLDLRFNPIVCDCSNLQFLKWVTSRKILYGNMSEYDCTFSDRSRKNMPNGYEEIVLKLERECTENYTLFISVTVGTVIFFCTLLGIIAYRFRWSVRYWYHTVKMMMVSRQEDQSEEFEYDAFVCYASKDEDFVVQQLYPELSTQRGIKLMIHGLNFRVGQLIIDNIILAVRQSRKTLVIVTRSMLESKWCLYELQMARMEAINTGRNVLVFMFLETIAFKDIHLDIVSYIKSNVVISYPTNPRQRKVFWDKLAHDIKHV